MKIISTRKVEIEVNRPNGSTETITHPKIDYMTDRIFAQFNTAMKKAGRGFGLSYKNIEAVVELEDSDYIVTTVNAHYCDKCATLLKAIGAGEITEMEQRSKDIPSYEPAFVKSQILKAQLI